MKRRPSCPLETTARWGTVLFAPYESSRSGPPAFEDVSALAQALVRAAPERMLWASNWPHPGHEDPRIRDDAHLLDLLIEWAPEDATRSRILVDNPAAPYVLTQPVHRHVASLAVARHM